VKEGTRGFVSLSLQDKKRPKHNNEDARVITKKIAFRFLYMFFTPIFNLRVMNEVNEYLLPQHNSLRIKEYFEVCQGKSYSQKF